MAERTPEGVELLLYLENDWEIYSLSLFPAQRNLQKKLDRGFFDRDKAVKLMRHTVSRAAKKYAKEYAAEGDERMIFDERSRKWAARKLVSDFEEETAIGNRFE